jgi:hypothetical protein
VPERLRADRLVRWTAYAAIPCTWLALALLDPLLLAVPVFAFLALRQAIRYGILERYEPEDDPDLI